MCKHSIGADGWEKPRDTIFARYRLRRILRALGLEPLNDWQRKIVVLGEEGTVHVARGNAKSTILTNELSIACLVRLLMWYRGVIDSKDILCAEILGDPDFYAASGKSRNYYLMEIEWAHAQCVAHGIRVFKILPAEKKRWWRP